MIFKDKKVLITGGTGSLGQKLVSRILTGELGIPSKLVVFSRDEAKQHQMRLEWKHKFTATDEIIYHEANDVLEFYIGDVRNFQSVRTVLKNVDMAILEIMLMFVQQ